MTEEVKKLIDGVETFYCFGNEKDSYQSMEKEQHVRKSDFDRVVNELTKWHKTTENPKIYEVGFSDLLLFRDKFGTVRIGWCKFSVHNGWSWLSNGDGQDFYYDYIVEWRHIY